ncbi:probable NOT transcription complex subunit VIP2 [Drosophila teissieri]|uniref:probable NOT transcription complex subunit VIP2 n=1 Tax=Drosophila teissieri TaxID=7243 RepID=UPI001CB9FD43|nr:probable NOT transcription complex subunit VIP2 [Drosophila teissieri]
MKRHYSKTVDDQQERENSPSPPPPPPYQSPLSSPESLQSPNGYPILYVDVVKNKPKLEFPPSPSPPQPPAPEFSIFREDFPALPGAAATALPSNSSSGVPDDWTAMLSESEQVELAKYRYTVVPSNPHFNASGNEVFLHPNHLPEKPREMEFLPPLYGYLSNPVRLSVSLIFDKQFLHEGVVQRAVNAAHKRATQANTTNTIHPPPGFENSKLFARLITNNTGMPLGGVNFELGSPLYDRMWNMETKSPGSAVEGSFGMLGLAKKLGSIHRNPLLFGNNVSHNMNGTADTIFSGPLQGGRLVPHEMSYNLPLNFLITANLNLQQPKTEEMQAELLFFFFYTYTGDMMQMLAAAELAERGWRYHKFERIWLIRQADNPNYLYSGFQESGEYNYFNMWQWKILPRHFQLEPEHMERTLSKEELYELYGYHPQMSGV